jgi:large subunit ribosomal protein L40
MFGLKRTVQKIQEPIKAVPLCSRIFSRGKRTTRKGLQPGAQRLINMLSVFSARKKQPRRLKLSLEDSIRHKVVTAAWSILLRDKKQARTNQLQQQYYKMKEACDELEQSNRYLAFHATKREKGKRFAPELRIPTETPPNQPWNFDWVPEDNLSNQKQRK